MNPVNKILLGVGAAIALAIIVTFVWLSLANAHLKTQLAEVRANDTACHMANDDFAAKTAQQDKAIEKLKAIGEVREKRAQAAAYQAQKTVRAYFLAAEKLGKTNPRGDACQAADNILNAYLGNAR